MTMMKKLNHLKYRILFMKLRAKNLWADRSHLLQAAALTTVSLWEGKWLDWFRIAARLDSKRTGQPNSLLSKARIFCRFPLLLWQSAYHQSAQGGHKCEAVRKIGSAWTPDGFTGWAYIKENQTIPKVNS